MGGAPAGRTGRRAGGERPRTGGRGKAASARQGGRRVHWDTPEPGNARRGGLGSAAGCVAGAGVYAGPGPAAPP